jgi:hypothetical protein
VPDGELVDAARDFVLGLLDVLELVCPQPELRIDDFTTGQCSIRPRGATAGEPGALRTTTSGIDIRFFYRYDLDPVGRFVRIQSSSIGLCLTPTGRCLVRVEYDRNKGGDRPEAHIQIDADGALWGKALTLSGQQVRPLHSLHIPAGGRRFRPTMEDFVEFLLAERFVQPADERWRSVLSAKRAFWEERQARAAARRHQAAVADTLQQLGWSVTRPMESGSG